MTNNFLSQRRQPNAVEQTSRCNHQFPGRTRSVLARRARTTSTLKPLQATMCPAPIARPLAGRCDATSHGAGPELVVDPELLKKLFNGSGTMIHLQQALPPEYCANVVRAAATVPFRAYAKTENSGDYSPILKFGPTVFDYIGASDKSGYFVDSLQAIDAGDAAFTEAGVVNPLTLVLRCLKHAWPGPVEVANEPGDVRYFAGVMRDIRGGALPHVDHARRETPELSIGSTIAQASLLIYVSVPSAGGALRVYDKKPTVGDYREHTLGYGFSPEAVRGATFRGVTPEVGSVVLFPTTQIHSVDAVTGTGRRITWSTFIGLRADGSLVLWS
jgi:hypothetical protein